MSEEKPIVYVVDDDQSVREGLGSLIRSAGLRVEAFQSAADFLEFQRPDTPACLVLDVRMPGLSGMELQRQLVDTADHIPIVFITGHGDIPMTVRAIKSGATDFLAKPFTDESILNAIEQGLSKNAQARQGRRLNADLMTRYKSLTSREQEIVPRIDKGMLNKQVASELGISEITVKVHRRNIMIKMGAKSVPDLVRMLEKIRSEG